MPAMERMQLLVEQRPLIALHLFAALIALAVGALVMLRRKGTTSHKRLGWFWVGLMAVTAGTGIFIRDYRLPNLFGYTPIHAFTLTVAVLMPLAIVGIRRGRVDAHRKTMRGLFYGACVTAGVFTLLPSRFLGSLLWKDLLGLVV
jgi:uncharacterized membrane protein